MKANSKFSKKIIIAKNRSNEGASESEHRGWKSRKNEAE